MAALHRHQLVRLNAAGWATVRGRAWDEGAQACLAHWSGHGLPLVVTQQRGTLADDQPYLGLVWGVFEVEFNAPVPVGVLEGRGRSGVETLRNGVGDAFGRSLVAHETRHRGIFCAVHASDSTLSSIPLRAESRAMLDSCNSRESGHRA